MDGRGDILRIDLSTEKLTREPITPELGKLYVGGEGINTYLFWKHFLKVDPKIDPLSPDNVIIFGLGPLGGTGYGGGSKARWTFKGPAYGIFADTTSGGAFSPQMRWAGYDHLVITGKAKRPVYIWINDDAVEFRDARGIWGKIVRDTNSMIRKELGDETIETACIGPAGENLVPFASITASADRSAGRTGPGCVFGSKNLKAIAVRGTKGIRVHDRRAFLKATEALMVNMSRYPDQGTFRRDHFKKFGTLGIIKTYNDHGWNSYRNAQGGMSPEIEKLTGEWYDEHMHSRIYACSPGCGAACQTWHHIKGDESPLASRYVGDYGTRPEYGSTVPFGISCDIADLPAVAHLIDMCNQYGLDIFEAGMTISLAMELYQRGIITPGDVEEWMGEPLSLEWGNIDAVEKLLEAIGTQKNRMGQILKGGVYRAAKTIEEVKGVPALLYANYGKGGATHIETMRSRPMLAFAGAVSAIGTHHLKGIGIDEKSAAHYFGKQDAADPWTWADKGKAQALAETFSSMYNSIGVCRFGGGTLRGFVDFSPELYAAALTALTGMEITPQELLTAGERTVNVQKAFNSRLGLRREDDSLGHRWMNEPMPDGKGKGMSPADFLEKTKDEYYEAHGWDKATSLQKRETLERLGLKDVADLLEKEGALA